MGTLDIFFNIYLQNKIINRENIKTNLPNMYVTKVWNVTRISAHKGDLKLSFMA